jgi:NAD-dependent DNA ligase
VGETTAKDIAKHFGTFKAISKATYEELLSVNGIGEKVSESVVDYFKADKNNQKLVHDLLLRSSRRRRKEKKRNQTLRAYVCHYRIASYAVTR